MKTIIFTLFLVSSGFAFACDNCNIYIGVSPNDFSHSLRLMNRYNTRAASFSVLGSPSLMKHGGETSRYVNQNVKEFYQSTELQGRYFFNPRFSATLNVMLRNNYRSINSKRIVDVKGIGDPVLLANYRLVNSKSSDSTILKHRLAVVGGVKVPLGSSSTKYNDVIVDHDMQPGTGAWSGILGLNYSLRIKDLGWLTQVNTKLNGQSKSGFQYGTSTNFSSGLFYLLKKNNWTISPFVGAYLESKTNDYEDGNTITNSEVQIVYLRPSISIYYKKLSLTGEYLKPLKQKIQGQNLYQEAHFNASLTYYFN